MNPGSMEILNPVLHLERGSAPDVVSLYRQQLEKRGFVSDPAQWRAVERLQRLYEEWFAYKARRSTRLRRLLVKPALPRGVYLWGGVGRGKSFLMDSFFLCAPLVRKRRVHFHHFMREVHRELDALKGTEDPLAAAAARTAKRYRLVCFDEFHVSDIADAMILGRYLEQVTARGVVFCMTSNYHPDELYANGLQREAFLPAIEVLKERLEVLHVDGGQDYRRRKLARVQVYHVPPGAQSDAALEASFAELADVEPEHHALDVEGRRIAYRKRAGGLVWFDFAVLCGG
ncbi:MAG: cell division protein ZapE, partial [Betaproteobacteria bacterium]|nr:cell division protein ZapE [Betaproteobacteria bacterium]